jgi:hypothetical protein
MLYKALIANIKYSVDNISFLAATKHSGTKIVAATDKRRK